jgi:hypothetical protein
MFVKRFASPIVIGIMAVIFQVNAQTITGIVKSTNGGILPGAKVSLAVKGNTTQSGSDGKFTISNITSTAGSAQEVLHAGTVMTGSMLHLDVVKGAGYVSVDMFTPSGIKIRTLVNRTLEAGSYTLEVSPENLAAGLYVLRVRIGDQVRSFALPGGRHARTGEARLEKADKRRLNLAKQQFEIVDTIVTELTGYYRCATPIPQYSGDYTVVLNVKPAAVNTKIYSERSMAQIDWGKTSVDVWDNYGGPMGTQLNGSYPDAFEGTNGWQVICGQGWSSWVFKSTVLTGVDMSAFTGGSLHVAIKGSAPSIGVFVSSVGAKATTVDLDSLGYKNDGLWHEMSVPLANFGAIDLTQVVVYAGFSAPADSSKDYAPGLSYVIDDLYFKPK